MVFKASEVLCKLFNIYVYLHMCVYIFICKYVFLGKRCIFLLTSKESVVPLLVLLTSKLFLSVPGPRSSPEALLSYRLLCSQTDFPDSVCGPPGFGSILLFQPNFTLPLVLSPLL